MISLIHSSQVFSKDSVDGMNVVGFFLAGSGRIDKYTIARELGIIFWDDEITADLSSRKRKNKVVVLAVEGDVTSITFYLLQGGRNLEVEMMVWMTSWSALPRVNSRLRLVR